MLPILQRDMTIYSLVAIAHRWGGASRGEQVCNALFGSPGAGLRHDFPSHLDEFSHRTELAYGRPDELALNATVLPYFLRFRPPEVQAEAIALMRGETVEPLKFILGLPAGPSGASMPLCTCEDCIREDKDAHGFAYWHRQHQLPGAFVCTKHGSPVLQSSVRIDGRGRSTLFLPDDPEIVSTSASFITVLQQPLLQRLSILSAAALNSILPGGYSSQILLATYQHGLKQQGLLTKCGQVRAREFVKWLRDQYHSIASLEPFNRIVDECHVEGMLRLVRKPRGNFHSACHLLLIDALFGSWDRFSSVYEWEHQMELPLIFQETPDSEESPSVCENETLVIELARRHKNGEGSVSALSKELGIDVNTAIRWLGKLGLLEIARRPKVLTHEIRAEIIQSIKCGEPFRQISMTFALSRATIDRICNEHPMLHETWRAASHERMRNVERQKLELLIRSSPDVTIAELRRAKNSGYSWLSRHDKEWLKSRSPLKTANRSRLVTKRRPRVDWSMRDHECLSALKNLEATLRFDDCERLKPMVVLRKIPNLSFSPRLDRLPESRALVIKILERAEGRRDK
ncbi:MAG: transposition protein, TnsD-related protein [Gallionellaceae bacterium]|nr:MAG: transposition protein, TnsD-related protein [Gallionellaceae bacterium]